MQRKGHTDDTAAASLAEKRREPRRPGHGPVTITIDEPVKAEIIGTLVDFSPSGFRAAHGHGALSKGQVVAFQHFNRTGIARVIWNRITADAVDTGFLIIESGRESPA